MYSCDFFNAYRFTSNISEHKIYPALLLISDLVHQVSRDEIISTDLQRCNNYTTFMVKITLLEFRFDSLFHEDYCLLGCDAVKSGRYVGPKRADFFVRWCTVLKISVKKC